MYRKTVSPLRSDWAETEGLFNNFFTRGQNAIHDSQDHIGSVTGTGMTFSSPATPAQSYSAAMLVSQSQGHQNF